MARPIDLLVGGGTLLTLDDRGRRFADGAVAVHGGRILEVGETRELAPRYLPARRIDARGGLILPGLVNAHTHAAMTLFRGLADDLPLERWLNDHIFPAEAALTEEQVYRGALLACAEMILSGTTTFCDMYLFEAAVARAAHEAGLRAVVGEVLFDFPSPHYGGIENGFAVTERLIDEWRGHPRVTVAVEPHSPYLCAPGLLVRAARLAARHGVPLVTHLAETRGEIGTIRERYGASPVEHLERLGVLGPGLLACHCVWVDEADIERLARAGVKIAHNAESNLKLASGVAPVPRMLAAGLCVGIGTDGAASNNDLDLLREMDTVAKIHKGTALDPAVMDAETVLGMATREGARALGLGELTGTLEPGKRADLIVVDTRRPHLVPLYQPASQLVYAARGSDVACTVVEGRVLMEGGRIETFDVEEAMAAVERLAVGIRGARRGRAGGAP